MAGHYKSAPKRIERVQFSGYRQYRNVRFDFDHDPDSGKPDLHIIVGKMGTGKTNFMNGINYLLYGDEPFQSHLEGLDIINTRLLEEEDFATVSVEMKVSQSIDAWTVSRSVGFVKDGEEYLQQEPTKRVIGMDGLEEEFDVWVNKFVPMMVREFFFFDGEGLERYFEYDKRDDVESTIKNMLRYDVLKDVAYALEAYISSIQQKIGIRDTDLRRLYQEYEKNSQEMEKLHGRLKMFEKKKSELAQKLKKIDDILKSTENIRLKKESRDTLSDLISMKKKELGEKEKQYAQMVTEMLAVVMVKDEMESLKEKFSKEGNVPIEALRVVIRRSIDSGRCLVCGSEIGTDERVYLEKKLSELDKASDTERVRGYFLSGYDDAMELISDAPKKIESLASEIRALEEEIKGHIAKLKALEKDIEKYAPSDVKKALEDRPRLQKDYENVEKSIAEIKEQIENLRKKMSRQEKSIQSKEKKVKNLEEDIRKKQYAELLLAELRSFMEGMLENVAKELSERSTEWFKKLMWKDIYDRVEITRDFEVRVIDKKGRNGIGTISGGEREALSLAYTLALHEVMGHRSPLVIDRPTSNISGESTKDAVEALASVAKDRQLIVLFTTDDWERVKDYIQDKASTIWFLHYDDESESTTANLWEGDTDA